MGYELINVKMLETNEKASKYFDCELYVYLYFHVKAKRSSNYHQIDYTDAILKPA